MPTALPAVGLDRRLTVWEAARFLWLVGRERHLARRVERASQRVARHGQDRGRPAPGAARRWLACHAEIAVLTGQAEPEDAGRVRVVPSRSYF